MRIHISGVMVVIEQDENGIEARVTSLDSESDYDFETTPPATLRAASHDDLISQLRGYVRRRKGQALSDNGIMPALSSVVRSTGFSRNMGYLGVPWRGVFRLKAVLRTSTEPVPIFAPPTVHG